MSYKGPTAEHHWMLNSAGDEKLPPTIGGARPSIPALWERARLFLARILNHVGPLESYARIFRVAAPERHDLRMWLAPAETLVRTLLVVEAITWLFMTPEGRKVFRETSKITPEQRFGACKAADPETVASVTSIPLDGLCRPPEAVAAPEPAPFEERSLADHRHSFKVFKWSDGKDEDGNPMGPSHRPRPQRSLRHLILTLDHPEPPDEDDTPRRRNRAGFLLAARIDALSRVIASPESVIRRLARQLATMDRESLLNFVGPGPAPVEWHRRWYQGANEVYSAARHLGCARRCIRGAAWEWG